MKVKEVTYDEIVEGFKNGVVSVVFTKLDGSSRYLQGTLSEDFLPTLPSNKNPEEIKKNVTNPTSLAVWEPDPGQWRSFRLETLQKFKGDHVKYVVNEE